jgi:hypothetical protein
LSDIEISILAFFISISLKDWNHTIWNLFSQTIFVFQKSIESGVFSKSSLVWNSKINAMKEENTYDLNFDKYQYNGKLWIHALMQNSEENQHDVYLHTAAMFSTVAWCLNEIRFKRSCMIKWKNMYTFSYMNVIIKIADIRHYFQLLTNSNIIIFYLENFPYIFFLLPNKYVTLCLKWIMFSFICM